MDFKARPAGGRQRPLGTRRTDSQQYRQPDRAPAVLCGEQLGVTGVVHRARSCDCDVW